MKAGHTAVVSVSQSDGGASKIYSHTYKIQDRCSIYTNTHTHYTLHKYHVIPSNTYRMLILYKISCVIFETQLSLWLLLFDSGTERFFFENWPLFKWLDHSWYFSKYHFIPFIENSISLFHKLPMLSFIKCPMFVYEITSKYILVIYEISCIDLWNSLTYVMLLYEIS